MAERRISHVQGKGSIAHNNRTFQPKNADKNRKKDNVTLIKEPIGTAYERIFGEAVAEYDSKQKRADRRIGDYYEHLFNRKPSNEVLTGTNKQKSFYEDLIQLGEFTDTACGTSAGELAKECLIEYMDGWEARNPNFKVFNAVIHMDEATPHLHTDYIPVCHSKRGLALQNGLAKALEEMGFGTGPKAISRWRERERAVFADICRSHGFEIAAEQQGRGHSFTVDEYKELQDAKRELQQDIYALEGKREAIVEEIKADAEAAVQNVGAKVSEELFRSPATYAAGIAYLTSCDDDEFERITNAGQKFLQETALDTNTKNVDELITAARLSGTGKLSQADKTMLWDEYRLRRDEVSTWARATSMTLYLARKNAYSNLANAKQHLYDMNRLLNTTNSLVVALFAVTMILIDNRRVERCQERVDECKSLQSSYQQIYNNLRKAQRIAAEDLINCADSAEKALDSMKKFIAFSNDVLEPPKPKTAERSEKEIE